MINLSRMRRKANRKVYNYQKNISHCRALSGCKLVLLLLIGSSHQAHFKWWNLCCTVTPRLLDAYRLRQKQLIPAFCVTYSHLSDDKFLCHNVGLGSSTQAQHGRRSVGDEGDADHPAAWGVSIGNVLILFQFIKQIYRHIKKLHRSSSKINNKI